MNGGSKLQGRPVVLSLRSSDWVKPEYSKKRSCRLGQVLSCRLQCRVHPQRQLIFSVVPLVQISERLSSAPFVVFVPMTIIGLETNIV